MKSRIGEIQDSKFGLMEIIEYNGNKNIKVKFKTGSIVKTQYSHFKIGNVKDPLFPSVFCIGCIGIGKYKPNINSKQTIEYGAWHNMLRRCYDPYYINKQPAYKDVTVGKEWLNFQNFAKWYKENHYELLYERVELDKDLIKIGNKIYCPAYCSFVPGSINVLLTKRDNFRGKCPVGVCFIKDKNKYLAQISINGKRKHLGLFTTPEKAFNRYKIAKEEQIKITANKYKEVLNIKVYNSLMNYKVEITD